MRIHNCLLPEMCLHSLIIHKDFQKEYQHSNNFFKHIKGVIKAFPKIFILHFTLLKIKWKRFILLMR